VTKARPEGWRKGGRDTEGEGDRGSRAAPPSQIPARRFRATLGLRLEFHNMVME
jgi:hypothetical protein